MGITFPFREKTSTDAKSINLKKISKKIQKKNLKIFLKILKIQKTTEKNFP